MDAEGVLPVARTFLADPLSGQGLEFIALQLIDHLTMFGALRSSTRLLGSYLKY